MDYERGRRLQRKIDVVLTGLLWMDIKDLTTNELLAIEKSYTYVHPKDETVMFHTYLYKNGKIGVPYGNRDKIHSIVPLGSVKDLRVSPLFSTKKVSKLKLRDYQEKAMKEIKSLMINGITEFNLSGKTGSGKSFMLSNLIAELGVKTLIIADKKMLINQLSKEIESTLGEKPTLLNIKNTKLGDINIATSQFISKNPDVWYQIKQDIGFLVLDEAESLASNTVTRIFQRSPARYKVYISATFTRSVDDRTSALIDFSGKNKVVLESTGNIIPSIMCIMCPEEFNPPLNKNLYARAKANFYTLDSIYDKIYKIITYSISKNRQVLVGADVSYIQNRINDHMNSIGIPSAVLSSSTKEQDRLTILEEFNKGNIKVIIGFGVLNAGLSIPKIQTIVRVSTPASQEKLEQFIGRGVRDFVGKEGLYVIDLVFKGFNYKVRRSLYSLKQRIANWNVFESTWEFFEKRLK